jgi:hypothetical protein
MTDQFTMLHEEGVKEPDPVYASPETLAKIRAVLDDLAAGALPPAEHELAVAGCHGWALRIIRIVLRRVPVTDDWFSGERVLRGITGEEADLLKAVYRVYRDWFGGTVGDYSVWIESEVFAHYFRSVAGRVYEVGLGRAQRLVKAEFRGLTTDDLRLPYKAVAVRVPKDLDLDLEFEAGSKLGSGVQSITQIYAAEVQCEGRRQWVMRFISAHGVLEYTLDLLPGASLEAQVGELATDSTFTSRSTREVFYWFLHVMLYVSMPAAVLEERVTNPEAFALEKKIRKMKAEGWPEAGKKIKGLAERLTAMDPRYRIVVDRNTPPWTPEEMGRTAEGRPLTLRIRVAGHWKFQPHGPERSLRKQIFVEPYWKGPLDGPQALPVHKVV